MSWVPLVGHDAILTALRHALRRGRLGHAFLFVGPPGVGKRRTARHVAQGLLCENRAPESLDPCGECAGCHQVVAETHPDFFEVGRPEDKNELPISVIQDLCAKLSLKPMRGRYKIAIVDDADLLNEEAANAFLKTLEEPPPCSLLILIATSAETQLATIVSRCQVLRFSELPTDTIADLLLKLGASDSAAKARRLAELGAGSVGQAIELAKDDWNDIRKRLLEGLSRLPEGAVELTNDLQAFIDEAGKESAPKRTRARQLIRLTADFYHAALRRRQSGDSTESAPAADLAARLDADTLLDLIDRCLETDYHIARFLNQQLTIDCWIDDLAAISSGHYVPPIK